MRVFAASLSRALPTAVLALASVGCSAGADEDAFDAALTPARSPHRVPELLETRNDAGSRDDAAGPDDAGAAVDVGGFDGALGPIGHCLNGGFDWNCAAGRTCTFTGHCTPADAGSSEAGSERCGLIFCDLAFCRCRSAASSLCDCE